MKFKYYSSAALEPYIRHRKGEKKFGEAVQCHTGDSEHFLAALQQSKASAVLIGIPEDIGIQANWGKKGARHAWEAVLTALLNTQHNSFNKGNKLFVGGHLDMEKELKEIDSLPEGSQEKLQVLGSLVEKIDSEVMYLVAQVVAAGKKPIVVGGGHNNAYGILKGCALALNKAVNAVNLDAHADFRKKERRHSGNAFSYARSEGFLQRYYILGLHQNYTSKNTFERLEKHAPEVLYTTFEEMALQQKKSFAEYLEVACGHVCVDSFGIEVDCDSVAEITSSAQSPSGFTVENARQFVSFMAAHKNALYLHLCEGAPNPGNEQEMARVGKFITYLITDFLREL
jgi:formiminoglutamase